MLTAIKFFIGKSVLDRSLLRLLSAWFLRVVGQIAAAHSSLLIFSSSEVTLIPWSAPEKSFDRLIQFWSRSQTLLHETVCDYPLHYMVHVDIQSSRDRGMFECAHLHFTVSGRSKYTYTVYKRTVQAYSTSVFRPQSLTRKRVWWPLSVFSVAGILIFVIFMTCGISLASVNACMTLHYFIGLFGI